MVIFGASGDLTQRKLIPALHNLQVEGLVPETTTVVGTARTELSREEFLEQLRSSAEEHSRITPTDQSWSDFSRDLCYVAGDASDERFFARLKTQLDEIDGLSGAQGNRVWYCSTSPELFAPIAEGIGGSGLLDTPGWHRLVVEKPFGRDLASARTLNATVRSHFPEDRVFRIDHYLGKETVQNLLVFRFANAIFEPIWNHRYIDHVQITVAESAGVEERGDFYEEVGALRDVGQNHLLQLLALTAMEPPVAWDADAIRSEKVQALRAVRRWEIAECHDNVARGQYRGYRDEEGVDPGSVTETFAAFKLFVDNWRWADVPFYLRTGKALAAQTTEIAIQFKRVPHLMFKKTAVEELDPNVLTIRIQPDECILLTFGTKVPGPEVKVRTVDMEFDYEQDFGSGTPEAYERLLLDCMLGDATLFARSDEIEEAWEIVEPILEMWEASDDQPDTYDRESWGPDSAEDLIGRDGHRWRDP